MWFHGVVVGSPYEFAPPLLRDSGVLAALGTTTDPRPAVFKNLAVFAQLAAFLLRSVPPGSERGVGGAAAPPPPPPPPPPSLGERPTLSRQASVRAGGGASLLQGALHTPATLHALTTLLWWRGSNAELQGIATSLLARLLETPGLFTSPSVPVTALRAREADWQVFNAAVCAKAEAELGGAFASLTGAPSRRGGRRVSAPAGGSSGSAANRLTPRTQAQLALVVAHHVVTSAAAAALPVDATVAAATAPPPPVPLRLPARAFGEVAPGAEVAAVVAAARALGDSRAVAGAHKVKDWSRSLDMDGSRMKAKSWPYFMSMQDVRSDVLSFYPDLDPAVINAARETLTRLGRGEFGDGYWQRDQLVNTKYGGNNSSDAMREYDTIYEFANPGWGEGEPGSLRPPALGYLDVYDIVYLEICRRSEPGVMSEWWEWATRRRRAALEGRALPSDDEPPRPTRCRYHKPYPPVVDGMCYGCRIPGWNPDLEAARAASAASAAAAAAAAAATAAGGSGGGGGGSGAATAPVTAATPVVRLYVTDAASGGMTAVTTALVANAGHVAAALAAVVVVVAACHRAPLCWLRGRRRARWLLLHPRTRCLPLPLAWQQRCHPAPAACQAQPPSPSHSTRCARSPCRMRAWCWRRRAASCCRAPPSRPTLPPRSPRASRLVAGAAVAVVAQRRGRRRWHRWWCWVTA